MRPPQVILVAAGIVLATSTFAWSSTPEEPAFDPMKMWSCPQPDGTMLYTNKDKAGCTLMTLKPLSVVPSLDSVPGHQPAIAAPRYEIPPYVERAPGGTTGRGPVPDWARDWQASIASSGSVQAEVCGLYGEWLHLNQKTRGGFFFGSDPSYGGDLSGLNQRGASYSFYDNARYVTLAKLFGQGFVPIGCQ